MLPQEIRRRFKNPGDIELEFLDYLKAAKLPIDNSKSIASVSYYDAKNTNGAGVFTFFGSSPLVSANTNVPGNNFVRPASEHAVIYAIRIESAAADVAVATFVPGDSGDAALNKSVFTLTNNGVIEEKNFPISEALSGLTTRDQGIILLDEPIIWAGQTELSIQIDTKGFALPAVFATKFKLIGIGLI